MCLFHRRLEIFGAAHNSGCLCQNLQCRINIIFGVSLVLNIGGAIGADNCKCATLGILMTKEMHGNLESGRDGTAMIAGYGGKLRK